MSDHSLIRVVRPDRWPHTGLRSCQREAPVHDDNIRAIRRSSGTAAGSEAWTVDGMRNMR